MSSRVPIVIRLDPDVVKSVESRAGLEKRNRSDMMRLMVAYALKTMPQGWVR